MRRSGSPDTKRRGIFGKAKHADYSPGEKRQVIPPTDVEARDVARLFSVGAYNLSDAEKAAV